MDLFGIGQGVQGAARVYVQSSRGCGRTTAMVESAKDGDRIIFTNKREADRVYRLCKDRGIEVECLVSTPDKNPLEHMTRAGRTNFDHSWVEEFYLRGIEDMRREIDYLEQNLSGHGEPHRKTKRAAMEIAKWGSF